MDRRRRKGLLQRDGGCNKEATKRVNDFSVHWNKHKQVEYDRPGKRSPELVVVDSD